jgi:hypothetical protein
MAQHLGFIATGLLKRVDEPAAAPGEPEGDLQE